MRTRQCCSYMPQEETLNTNSFGLHPEDFLDEKPLFDPEEMIGKIPSDDFEEDVFEENFFEENVFDDREGNREAPEPIIEVNDALETEKMMDNMGINIDCHPELEELKVVNESSEEDVVDVESKHCNNDFGSGIRKRRKNSKNSFKINVARELIKQYFKYNDHGSLNDLRAISSSMSKEERFSLFNVISKLDVQNDSSVSSRVLNTSILYL